MPGQNETSSSDQATPETVGSLEITTIQDQPFDSGPPPRNAALDLEGNWIPPNLLANPGVVVGGYVEFNCSCGRKLRVREEFAGKKGQCPSCGQTLDIPY